MIKLTVAFGDEKVVLHLSPRQFDDIVEDVHALNPWDVHGLVFTLQASDSNVVYVLHG